MIHNYKGKWDTGQPPKSEILTDSFSASGEWYRSALKIIPQFQMMWESLHLPLIHLASGLWAINSFLKRSSKDNLVSDEFASSSKTDITKSLQTVIKTNTVSAVCKMLGLQNQNEQFKVLS